MLQQNELEEKAKIQSDIQAKIGTARINVIGSAYRHTAEGDKQSVNVGTLSNAEAEQFIIESIQGRALRYTGKGKNGGHACMIDFGGKERITFEYDDDDNSATVYHCGPGG